jgi:hypothetical protein
MNPASVGDGQSPTKRMRLRSSCEHPNRNTLHVQLPLRASLRPAEDASKLPKFLSVLPVLRQRQEFVVPIDVQVIFGLGLNSPE